MHWRSRNGTAGRHGLALALLLFAAAVAFQGATCEVCAARPRDDPPAPRDAAVPDSSESLRRPALPLPDISLENDELDRIPAAMPRAAAATGLTGWAGAESGDASLLPALKPPCVVVPPAVHAQPRQRGGFAVSAADGPQGAVRALSVPTRGTLLWGDASGWRGRITGRSHLALAAGCLGVRPALRPLRRAGLEMGAHWEDWEALPARGLGLPGAMRIWAARAFVEQGIEIGREIPVVGLHAELGDSRVRVCESEGCPRTPLQERGARWRLIEAGLALPERAGGWQTPARARVWSARIAPQVDFWCGVAHRAAPSGADVTRGRWRGELTWNLRRADTAIRFGLAGGGEGRASCLAPRVEVTCPSVTRGLRLRVAVAPEILYVEENLTRDEPLGLEPWLVTAVRCLELPSSPMLVDPRLPPQRAWPRIEAELLRQGDHGWMLGALTCAHVRDPLSWSPDSLYDSPGLWITSAGRARTIWRLAFAVQRELGGHAHLRLRYRWVRDTRADEPAALLFLPAHVLRAIFTWQACPWLCTAGTTWRGRAAAGADRERLARSIDVTVRIGRGLAGGMLSLFAENLLDQSIAGQAGEVLRGRRFGIEWSTLSFASVP